MIDRGATTIWETWKESDNTFSNCHPMFGTVTEWYYRWLGGIRPIAGHPGFSEFTLAPSTPQGLESVDCTYHTPLGPIESSWKKEPDHGYVYTFSIPTGSIAHVSLPMRKGQRVSLEGTQPKIEGLLSGTFQLNGGTYQIRVSAD